MTDFEQLRAPLADRWIDIIVALSLAGSVMLLIGLATGVL